MKVAITRLPHGQGLPAPHYATAQSAGADLPLAADLTLAPGARALAPTGLALALPPGFEAQVRPRSGLAIKWGLTLINAPGTIDADYRGEIKVALINLGQETITLKRGDRIAQLIIAPVVQAFFEQVAALPASGRGSHGFGSSGV